MANDVILETEGLTKEFRGFVAVLDVNLRVRRGTIHALIGPNGAGKTTCFNLLTKFLTPTRGRITFKGQDITGAKPPRLPASAWPARSRSRRSSRTSPCWRTCAWRCSAGVETPLISGARRASLTASTTRAMELMDAVGLAAFADTVAVELPYGRKRALEIATTLALDPETMLLDEPTAGMGREDIDRITGLIRQVSAGRTVLMVEHNLSVVADLCDTITVLARGEVLAEGDYASVSRNPRGHPGLPGHYPCLTPLPPRRSWRSRICTPGTGSRTSSTAWTSRCRPARWSRSWGGTGPARRPRSSRSWAWLAGGRDRSASAAAR